MKSLKFSRFARARAAALLTLALGLGVISNPANAIFLEADAIEADGVSSTVDLWFFSFDALATATIQVNDLGGPPIAGADPDMIIYLDDGTFSNVFAMDTSVGDAFINAVFPAGSYVAVVANHPLAVGQFGPTLADAALAVGGYSYEFNGPEPVGGQITINCVLSGNLGGGYTTRVLAADTCQLPPTSAVAEPSVLGLLAVGLLGLGLYARRRSYADKAA